MTFVLASLLFLGPVSAQDDRHTLLARELFDEGNALMRRHEYVAAAQRFERALTLRPTAYVRYNLAAALVETGELVRATHLLRAIGDDSLAAPEVRTAAGQRLAELEPRLARLTIRIEGNLGRGRVYLGRRAIDVSMLDGALVVDPGRQVISVRVGRDVVLSREVDVGEGASGEAVLELEPDSQTSSLLGDPTEPLEDDETIFDQWWFWTIGAVLVAGGAAAIVVAAMPGERDPYPASLGTIPVP